MFRQAITTPDAPAAIGPYSQAVRVGELVFMSGQIPLDPVSMQLVSDEPEPQIHQVFANLRAVANAAGGSLADVTKLTIYLTDLSQFELVNTVMAEHFSEPYPARAAIGVAALPRGAQIEIEAILILPT